MLISLRRNAKYFEVVDGEERCTSAGNLDSESSSPRLRGQYSPRLRVKTPGALNIYSGSGSTEASAETGGQS